MRTRLIAALVATLALAAGTAGAAGRNTKHDDGRGDGAATATPIKHLVVIFQENVSFDHYFATYPNAANPPGEPPFGAAPSTPSVNGLGPALLAPNNPNSTQPFRLGRNQAETCDQDHR